METRSLLKRISITPDTLHGKPRVKGTRIAVSMVLELLARGLTPKEICSPRFYPDLTLADVYACVAFAEQFLEQEEIHFCEELKQPS